MGDDRRILDESQHNPCIPFSSHVVFRNASSWEGGDWVGGWRLRERAPFFHYD